MKFRTGRCQATFLGVLTVAAVSLTACGGGSTSGDQTSVDGWSGEFAGTELHFLGEATVNSQILEDLVGDFEEKTGITVVVEQAPFDQLVQKTVLDYSTKRGAYDVISIPIDYLGGFAEQNYLEPIDPLLEANSDKVGAGFDQDDFLPRVSELSGVWQDTNYGFPSNTASMLMMYRDDLLSNPDEQAAFNEKYGYDLAPAETFAEYRDIAEFFTRPAGATLAGQTLTEPVYGIAMAGKRHAATGYEWMNYSWAYGGDLFDEEGYPAIDSEENIRALEFWKELSAFAPPSFPTATWDEVTSQLQQGVAVQALRWTDTAGSIENEAQSTVAGKMGYASIPVLTEGAEKYSFLSSWTYTVNANSAYKDASALFIAWATSAPVQRELAAMGGQPTLESTFADKELLETLPYWEQTHITLTEARARARIPQISAIADALTLGLSEALSGGTSSAAALGTAQDATEEILKDALPVTEF